MLMHVSPALSHAVQVCDIVAVSNNKDDDRGDTDTRRSQKKAKTLDQLYPHAFTGMKPALQRTI